MIASVSTSPSIVSAADTSFSGRCVVASATRSGLWPVPASIITTRGVRVRSARYSVWPVNGTPASLMVLFCSGAVTIASYRPASAPSIAASSNPSTYGPFAASSLPACTGTASA